MLALIVYRYYYIKYMLYIQNMLWRTTKRVNYLTGVFSVWWRHINIISSTYKIRFAHWIPVPQIQNYQSALCPVCVCLLEITIPANWEIQKKKKPNELKIFSSQMRNNECLKRRVKRSNCSCPRKKFQLNKCTISVIRFMKENAWRQL